MQYLERLRSETSIHAGDLPISALGSAKQVGLVAWDIETSGLDWKEDQIGVCQVHVPDSGVHVVQIGRSRPSNLGMLLSDPEICKIFHHAMFDLRFMVYQWSIQAQNVACTKIASKILDPSRDNHSLKSIVRQYLGVPIDKRPRTTNWLAANLTSEQINYAVTDVLYLPRLLEALRQRLLSCARWKLAAASFDYLPVRVQLDILGAGDIFIY